MNKDDDSGARNLDDITRLKPAQGDDEKTRIATPRLNPRPDTSSMNRSDMNPRGIDPRDMPTVLVQRDVKPVSEIQPENSDTDNSDTEQNPDEFRILGPGSLIKKRFLLVEELGKGGMGVVYTARDLVHEEAGEVDSLVAIKLLSDSIKDHPEALHMLQQETKKSRQLAHPNIVTVYDFDRDNDLVYMTMELLSGQSLEDYLEQNRHKSLDKELIDIIADISHGLMYAHQRNIIHSDLKPSNIFLTDKGAKVLDFGIARAVNQSDTQQSSEEKCIALTPSYASLEMFQDKPPDPRDDIYALACICYELIANKHPYKRRPATEAHENAWLPEKINTLKEHQWQALLKGLALKREHRTLTVGEFLRDLLPKRRQPRKIALVLLIIVSLSSGLYYFFRPTVIVEPSLFENPPAETELSLQHRAEVDASLEVAEVHMMVGRLLNPPGGNALDEYRKVLEMHPYNRQAIQGLEELMQQLVVEANSSIEAGNETQAREIVQAGLKIYGKHDALQTLNQQLNKSLNQRFNKPGELSND